MTAVMNYLRYDAAVIGNHEFDGGVPLLRERIAEASFPFLGANVLDAETGKGPAWLDAYTIVERLGVRLAVIGLITEQTPLVTLPSHVKGLTFLDPAPVAQEWIDVLVPDSADAAVLLVHIGGDPVEGGGVTGPIADLARRVHGEAAVLGGHTHRVFAETMDGTPLVMAGSSLRAFGRVDLEIRRRDGKILRSSAEVLPVYADSIEADAEVTALVEGFREELGPRLGRVLAVAEEDLPAARQECPVASLFCDALREELELDMVLHNPGGIRAGLLAGEITYADVYRVMPFDNTVVIVPLTGRRLEQVLVQAAQEIGFLHSSGLSYELDRRGGGVAVVEMTGPGGAAIEPDRAYRVGINSFMAEGGDGLTLLSGVPGAMDTMLPTRELFANWLEKRSARGERIGAPPGGRVRIIR